MQPCYNQKIQSSQLLQNFITLKFLVICSCHNVEQTGCCWLVLIKKQIDVSQDNFTGDSTFFATKLVTMILAIVSLRATTLLTIFSSPLSCQHPLSLFWNISNSVLEKNFFQQHFILLIQLKSERKIADFRFFQYSIHFSFYISY